MIHSPPGREATFHRAGFKVETRDGRCRKTICHRVPCWGATRGIPAVQPALRPKPGRSGPVLVSEFTSLSSGRSLLQPVSALPVLTLAVKVAHVATTSPSPRGGLDSALGNHRSAPGSPDFLPSSSQPFLASGAQIRSCPLGVRVKVGFPRSVSGTSQGYWRLIVVLNRGHFWQSLETFLAVMSE